MPRHLAWLAATVALSLPTIGTAQSDIPNLVGSWQCDDAPILYRGEVTQVQRSIEVTEQHEAVFEASHDWALAEDDGVIGHTFGEDSVGGTVPLVGVIDFDNETLHGAAFGDGHEFDGRIVDADTLQVVFKEPGDHAWVSRTTCHRAGGG